eukprot:755545-Hanusia_phi.AAC.2
MGRDQSEGNNFELAGTRTVPLQRKEERGGREEGELIRSTKAIAIRIGIGEVGIRSRGRCNEARRGPRQGQRRALSSRFAARFQRSQTEVALQGVWVVSAGTQVGGSRQGHSRKTPELRNIRPTQACILPCSMK